MNPFCLYVVIRIRLLFIVQLLIENFSCLLIRDKFRYFLRQISGIKLFAHLRTQLETLAEVKHVHVIEHFLLLFAHNAQSDRVQALFIHVSLQFNDLVVVHDGLTLREFVVILRPEVLQ